MMPTKNVAPATNARKTRSLRLSEYWAGDIWQWYRALQHATGRRGLGARPQNPAVAPAPLGQRHIFTIASSADAAGVRPCLSGHE
jgi:hypothetical protein